MIIFVSETFMTVLQITILDDIYIDLNFSNLTSKSSLEKKTVCSIDLSTIST